MNELLNYEAEELELAPDLQPGFRKKRDHLSNKGGDDSVSSTSSEEEPEIISLHITCTVNSTDDLISLCGAEGVWQVGVFVLGCLCGINCSIQNFIYLFIAETPEYFCSYPTELNQSLYKETFLKNTFIPTDTNSMVENCIRYQSKVSEDGRLLSVMNSTERCNTEEIPVQYEGRRFPETIGTEWSLVCNDAFWVPGVEATYMVGVLVGSIVFGILSDKVGRRKTILVTTFMFLTFAPLVGLSTNFITVIVFRFLLGMASPGVYSTTYVLVVEAIGSKKRGLAGSLFAIPYSIGYTVLPVIAYFVREWRNLQLTCSSVAVLLFVTWWHLPESPRWLLLKGKVKPAEKLFREIARVNGKELPPDFRHLVVKVAAAERESKHEITCDQRCRKFGKAVCQLLHTPVLRFRVLCMSVAFVAYGLVYYGIAISPAHMGFDKYLFTFLCGAFAIPGEIIASLLIETHGRRFVFSGFFFVAGSCLLLTLAFPKGSLMNMILFVGAFLFISGNATLIYLYSAELFPTEVRGYCLGISSMVGRSGSIAVPYIVELLGTRRPTLPSIVFGTAAVFAAALAILLPETKNKKFPDTVAEVENRKQHKCCKAW